jgi:enamine deaminase RidA (YjgF/YER057c/UK114 family)
LLPGRYRSRFQLPSTGPSFTIKRLPRLAESNTLLELMTFKFINPESLGPPSGFANGLLTEPGAKLLFIAGQVAWDTEQRIVSDDFIEQFDRALANVIAVVEAAGGSATQIARLIIYVTNKQEYRSRRRELGERYRARMGKHYPAMVLVEVKGLLDDQAKVEIEGIAAL